MAAPLLVRSLSLDAEGGPSLLPDGVPALEGEERSPGRTVEAGKAELGAEKAAVAEEDAGGAYLPNECVKLIQAHLIAGEQLGVAALHLLNMASVCRQWREVAGELVPGSSIAFDCFENAFPSQASVQKFRKLSSTLKEVVFMGAARLFHGYGDITLSGDGVSDRVLAEVAARNGLQLSRAKVQNSAGVTDKGLLALVAGCKNVHTVELQGLSKPCSGNFLTVLFENCPQLTALHLTNMPALNWLPAKVNALHWGPKRLTKLTVRGVNLDSEFGTLLRKFPELQELELDGSAHIIRDAVAACPSLTRVSYTVSSRSALDEALAALMVAPQLRHLELVVRNFTLCADQLRLIGMLPLVELRLDSFIHKQQPTLSRSSYSHVDNEGVKALVDSICTRWCNAGPNADMTPLKLSLCGASALTHDAVSALLRLPILTELDIGGCARIIAMDKMRLVAKVRAGRELLDSGRRPASRPSRFPGLAL